MLKQIILFIFWAISCNTFAQQYQNLANGLQLQSDGEILLDETKYDYTTVGNTKIFHRYQEDAVKDNKKYIEGNTVIEFNFENINESPKHLKSLTTMMQVKEGFNIEHKNYLNDYPDKGTFCSDFSGTMSCFTIGAYFCSKLYRHFGNQTNAFKNRTKIYECYQKVDFLRMYTTIEEDPKSKELKKITEENVEIIKSRFSEHFGKRKTKEVFKSVDYELMSKSENDERAEYFVHLMKMINSCETMFKTSDVLKYMENHQDKKVSPAETKND